MTLLVVFALFGGLAAYMKLLWLALEKRNALARRVEALEGELRAAAARVHACEWHQLVGVCAACEPRLLPAPREPLHTEGPFR
jgi:hypothetical protein